MNRRALIVGFPPHIAAELSAVLADDFDVRLCGTPGNAEAFMAANGSAALVITYAGLDYFTARLRTWYHATIITVQPVDDASDMLQIEQAEIDSLAAGACAILQWPWRAVGTVQALIAAKVRRNPTHAADMPPARLYAYGPIAIDADRHEVRINGALVSVPPKEFALLTAFVRSPGRIISHPTLIHALWGVSVPEESNYRHLRVVVQNLRLKLPDAGRMIESHSGIGYGLYA